MNLFTALVLAVFTLSSKAENYQEYPTFVTDEDFEPQFFTDDIEDTNYTPGDEDLSDPGLDLATTVDSMVHATKISFLQPDNFEVESDRRNENVRVDESQNLDLDFAHSGHRLSSLEKEDEMSSEKVLGQFPPMLQDVYKNYEESFQNKNTEPNQAPMRREINAWRDEFSNMDSVPWSMDAFYPRHGSPNSRNDYFDDSSYAVEPIELKNHSVTDLPPNVRELIDRDEESYYQKNYYYNYYPAGNAQKASAQLPGANEESIEIANPGAKKFLRKNPCKQYLQFLKYAFEKLDENADYNYDYSEDNEDWRMKTGPKNPKVFAVHLLGPTLYVDNSGKVSQINAKGNSYQPYEGQPHTPKNFPDIPVTPGSRASSFPTSEISKTGAMPWHDYRAPSSTLPPNLPTSSMRTERPTTQATENNFFEQSRTTTEQPWLMFSLKTNLTGSNATKEPRFYPDVQHRSSFGSRVEEEWKQNVRNEGYETTLRTKTEQMIFDEYEYGETKPTHSPPNSFPPIWFPSEEYYRKLAKALERKDNDTKGNAIASETNAAVGPPLYMIGRTSTPQMMTTTTTSPFFTKTFRPETTEVARYSPDKRDEDCNDRTLPCPDTVNVTYPLNGYCNRYVSCESGRAIRKTCPEGLHFNLVTKSCDLPHNSFCSYSCPSPIGHFGIPGDCNGFFSCKNSVPEYRMCPPRMHWDINKNTCTFAELSSCPMKCTKPNEISPYEGDCKAYIICLNGIPYYHKCPPSAKFDKDAQSCVPQHQSRCEDDPRLLTKTSNPNHLCRNVEIKLGSKVWCNHFFPDEGYSSGKQFDN